MARLMYQIANHIVATDPGSNWVKENRIAVDAPPDSDTNPSPEPHWPQHAIRSGLCGVVSPNTICVANGYRMYYTQILPRPGFPGGANDYDNATARILSAFSPDGSSFVPEPGTRLTCHDGGAGDFRVVSPEVVTIPDGSGRMRMYFECCAGTQANGSSIRSAVSDDGLSWDMEPGERLSGSSYNSPRVLTLHDGTCRLYCQCHSGGIISALSDDGGLTFVPEPGKRITQELPYEATAAFAPEVLYIESSQSYRMFYAGYSDPTRAYILTATSDDGLTWQKDAEPVIAPGGTFDQAKCSEMCVIQLPTTDNAVPKYRLFYEACDGTSVGNRGVWRILSATTQ